MLLQVENLVLHEEAVRKGMVELDAKMSQFLVEYFPCPADISAQGVDISAEGGKLIEQSVVATNLHGS